MLFWEQNSDLEMKKIHGTKQIMQKQRSLSTSESTTMIDEWRLIGLEMDTSLRVN